MNGLLTIEYSYYLKGVIIAWLALENLNSFGLSIGSIKRRSRFQVLQKDYFMHICETSAMLYGLETQTEHDNHKHSESYVQILKWLSHEFIMIHRLTWLIYWPRYICLYFMQDEESRRRKRHKTAWKAFKKSTLKISLRVFVEYFLWLIHILNLKPHNKHRDTHN